jgi:large subunit ribosomal protein L32
MAVPRNRLSNARKNSRRAHHAKKPKNCSPCENCGTLRMPHRLCPACGTYQQRSYLKEEEQQES